MMKPTRLLAMSLLALLFSIACSSPVQRGATEPTAEPEPSAGAAPDDGTDPDPATSHMASPAGRSARVRRRPARAGKLSAEAKAILKVHNAARRAVGVPALRWSAKLARYARAWANRLARQQTLQHRPPSGRWKQLYGENLAMAGGSNPIANYGAVGSRQWLGEKRRYRHGQRSLAGVGHYTQMVWRKTLHIGCAVVRYRKGPWHNVILVCNYDPPGNMMGQRPY